MFAAIMVRSFCLIAVVVVGAVSAGFVGVSNGAFVVDGEPVSFSGTNNLYMQLADNWEVADTVRRAVLANFSLIRIWAFSDTSFCPGESPQQPIFQCWDNSTASVWTNESALEAHLDYAVAAAGAAGIKVILCLVNNWSAYGGVPAYLTWRSAFASVNNETFIGHHDDFFSDSIIRGWYRAWATRLATRVNTVSGVAYRSDPCILAWELANELSCGGDDPAFNTSSACVIAGANPSIAAWVSEMAQALHESDSNHLVAVGDEGFYGINRGDVQCPRNQWWCSGQSGDWLSLIALPEIDFGTIHMYPDSFEMRLWGISGGDEDAVAKGWILNHSFQAAAYGKPIIMEEFGYDNSTTQHVKFANYLSWGKNAGIGGWAVWMQATLNDQYYTPPAWPSWWGPGDAGLQVYCLHPGDPPAPNDGYHDNASCAVLVAAAKNISLDIITSTST